MTNEIKYVMIPIDTYKEIMKLLRELKDEKTREMIRMSYNQRLKEKK